jgi:hypothetical protein
MSKSFRDVDYLRTSASMQADLPEILTSDMWQILIERDSSKALLISSPHSSPIWLLLLILISFKVLLF